MRGEHRLVSARASRSPGSSPHARGTPAPAMQSMAGSGIIPACAGNTHIAVSPTGGVRDHPRMRGEHDLAHYLDYPVLGSSPHARGTLRRWQSVMGTTGIIPACAGNTNTSTTAESHVRDHPRMRGEHPSLIAALIAVLGSSPHARGTHLLPLHTPPVRGIIPACAGNTSMTSCRRSAHGDHPRMRGEHDVILAGVPGHKGSSPHARGTLSPR